MVLDPGDGPTAAITRCCLGRPCLLHRLSLPCDGMKPYHTSLSTQGGRWHCIRKWPRARGRVCTETVRPPGLLHRMSRECECLRSHGYRCAPTGPTNRVVLVDDNLMKFLWSVFWCCPCSMPQAGNVFHRTQANHSISLFLVYQSDGSPALHAKEGLCAVAWAIDFPV